MYLKDFSDVENEFFKVDGLGRRVFAPDTCKNSSRSDYKKELTVIKEVAILYNVCFQRLLVKTPDDFSKYIIFDSNGKHLDASKFLYSKPGDLSKEEQTIAVIDFALINLEPEESIILYNDFFFPKAKKWWVGRFTRSVYYRVKKEAVIKFVNRCQICSTHK